MPGEFLVTTPDARGVISLGAGKLIN